MPNRREGGWNKLGVEGCGGRGVEKSSKLNKWSDWISLENLIAGVGLRKFIWYVEIENKGAEVFWVAITL